MIYLNKWDRGMFLVARKHSLVRAHPHALYVRKAAPELKMERAKIGSIAEASQRARSPFS